MSTPLIEAKILRQALGRYATGVTIVTCRDTDGAPLGFTCNSFSSLSLNPPLVLWSLRSISQLLPAFRDARHWAVNVLSEGQVDLSRRFAAPIADKFSEGAWSAGHSGVPVLSGCSAVIECEQHDALEAGDHWLFIGRVLGLTEAPIAPLVFQSGRYHLLGEIL